MLTARDTIADKVAGLDAGADDYIFDRVRLRLSLNYLSVISLVLLTFAIGVRILVDRILHLKIIDRLEVIAESALDNVELDEDRLMFDRELTDRHRINLNIPVLSPEYNLELFDLKGNQLSKLGKLDADLALSLRNFQQVRSGDPRFQYVTLPLVENNTNLTVGYIRASQSLTAIDASLHKLDLGLIGGIGLTLLLSSGGAIWLTKQAMKPAEDSFQQLQQFTADASHELRSPLMAIVSNTRVALKYPAGIRAGDIDKFQSSALLPNICRKFSTGFGERIHLEFNGKVVLVWDWRSSKTLLLAITVALKLPAKKIWVVVLRSNIVPKS